MLKQFSEEEIESRYQKLPEELQAAMYDFDVADKTFQLGKKHGLSTDKIGTMAEILGYVVLGFIGPREFVKTLSEDLGIDVEKAKVLASEINSTLFAPIRGMLKRTHDIEFTEEEIQRGGEEIIRKAPQAPELRTEVKPPLPESKPTFPGVTPLPKTSPIDLRGQEPSRPPFTPKPGAISEVTPPKPQPEVPVPPSPSQPILKSDFNKPAPQPSWILQKPTVPTPPETRSEPKIELTPTPTQTELKKEPELIPPPPRQGPRIPPIDLRGAPIPPKPTAPPQPMPPSPPIPSPQTPPNPVPKSYKEGDPYKEPIE